MLVRRWTMVGEDAIHSREVAGAGTAGTSLPLVLLHGVGATTRYFRPLLRELEGRVPSAAVDLPGIGHSSSSRLPADIAGQADVVADWQRATGRHPAVLVGNSMGSQTAIEVAVRHPTLVRGLVLIGPTIDRRARGPMSQLGKLLVDATVEHPGLVALTLSDSFLTRRRAVLRYALAALDHRPEERIARVTVPVLVLRGERDPLAPRRWAREIAQAVPDGRLVEIPGGAHACHYGHAAEVAEALLTWVGSLQR